MYRYWLCISMLLTAAYCFANAQTYKPDSLRTALRKAIADKSKTIADTATINNMNKLAAEYISPYPDSTVYYGQIAVKNSRKINYTKGIADGLLITATVYADLSKYDIAEKNLSESVRLYTSLNDSTGLSNTYIIYGRLYNKTGKYREALTYLKKALSIQLPNHNLTGMAKTYLNLGNVYDNLGYPSVSLDYYFKSLNINTSLHKARAMAANYNNIGFILQSMEIYPEALEYFNKALLTWKRVNAYGGTAITAENIGEILTAQHQYNEALQYFNESLKIFRQQDDKDGISNVYNHLAVCLMYLGQHQQALNYLQQSLQIATANQLTYNQASSLGNIALYYNTTLDYKQAYDSALKAKTLANSLGNIALRTSAYTQLIKALGGLNKYKEAFAAQRELDAINSTIKQNASLQKFTSYKYEYNYANKQKQQLLQQKANNLIYQQKIHAQRLISIIFGIVIFAMLVILTVYYNQRRKELKINAKLIEKNQEVVKQKANLDEQANKLNELNKLKDRLISIMAHDLRSPLGTLRGMFTLLEDETITHEQLVEMMPNVLKKLEYTSDFLDTLLFWVNSQMDNFELSVKRFYIKQAVNELAYYEEQAAAKGVTLTQYIPDELTALSDINSVRIVIRNLVTNAIKFSCNNGKIEVRATRHDHQILITVKDTGLGMTPAQCQNLFKNRVESKTGTNNESGTGMGLLFCKDLVENCNGKIWVTSAEGAGTTFSFTIPA